MLLYFTCSSAAGVSAGRAPTAFYSCTSYHCKTGQQVQLSEAQWQAVRRLFQVDGSAEQERQALRQAIALLEQQTGRITGTWRDLAGNVAGAGLPGQLDCISESRNTTTYLHLLDDAGLLRYHAVEERERRNPLILNIHWTAVIRDIGDDRRYAVDSWFLDNGLPPYIQPLEDWKSGADFERGEEDLGDQ